MKLSRLLPFLPLPLSAAGIVIATILVREHLTVFAGGLAEGPFCGQSARFDCTQVAAHESSWLFGIPLATVGLIFYICVAAIALVGLLLRGDERKTFWKLGRVVAVAAFAFDLYLATIMVTQIGHICLGCVTTYALNLGLVLTFWRLAARPGTSRWRALLPKWGGSDELTYYRGAIKGIVAVAAVVVSALVVASVLTPLGEIRGYGEREIQNFLARTQQPPEVDMARFDAQPSLGPASARLTIVVVGDFQCSYCRALANEIAVLRQHAADRIRTRFINSPIDPACNPATRDIGHSDACWLAEASHCAGAQGKFWEYHDYLTERIPHPRVDRRTILKHLANIGLDPVRFGECMQSGAARESVQAEIALCRELGLTATPSVVINGHVKRGTFFPWMLRRVVARLLERETGEPRSSARP